MKTGHRANQAQTQPTARGRAVGWELPFQRAKFIDYETADLAFFYVRNSRARATLTTINRATHLADSSTI
jgi:hypothetical protein